MEIPDIVSEINPLGTATNTLLQPHNWPAGLIVKYAAFGRITALILADWQKLEDKGQVSTVFEEMSSKYLSEKNGWDFQKEHPNQSQQLRWSSHIFLHLIRASRD